MRIVVSALLSLCTLLLVVAIAMIVTPACLVIFSLNFGLGSCDDTETSGEKMTGLILDELRPIYPEVCIGGDDNSIGTVNYAGLVPMLVKAGQEQQQQIEALKTEMEDLKKIA